jgi:Ca-activated chloride channel family protein
LEEVAVSFGLPSALWLIPACSLLLLAFYYWAWRKRQALAAQFVQSRLLASLTVGVSRRRVMIRHGLVIGAVSLLLFCLAQPRYGFDWEEARQRGLDIVVAVDISRSMLASDVAPSRLARAKLAALDLAAMAKSDRLGLIAFSGTAFLQCPLTLDESAFRQSVDALDVGLIADGGTAIGEAIRAASKAFEKENDNHKILVLFTDGEDQDGGAVEAADEAAAKGMRIFTVGVGTANGELIRLQDANGAGSFLKDEEGNVVKSRLNETMLKEIAEKAHGFYMPLRGARPVETLYERGLAPLPKSDSASKLVKLYHEIYHWPLGLAMILLVAEMFVSNRKRSVPKPPAGAAPPVIGAARAALVAGLSLAAFQGTASPSTALRDYRNGKFDSAFKEYDHLAETRTNDYRLHYNAGTAAYQAKQFDVARRHLSESVLSPDPKLQEDSFYNLGNSFYQSGQSVSDLDQKSKMWDQALKSYDAALKLNAQDKDAKQNYAFVQKELERLKQQQQQSEQNNGKDNKKNKDEKDGKDKKDEDKKKDQDKSDPKKQDEGQDKKPDKDKDKGKDKDKDQSKQGEQKDGDKSKDGQKASQDKRQAQPPKPGEKGEKGGPDQEEMAAAAGQMTPAQAQQFLESQKEGEKTLVFQAEKQQTAAQRAAHRKEW